MKYILIIPSLLMLQILFSCTKPHESEGGLSDVEDLLRGVSGIAVIQEIRNRIGYFAVAQASDIEFGELCDKYEFNYTVEVPFVGESFFIEDSNFRVKEIEFESAIVVDCDASSLRINDIPIRNNEVQLFFDGSNSHVYFSYIW